MLHNKVFTQSQLSIAPTPLTDLKTSVETDMTHHIEGSGDCVAGRF
jgi:hypothetical protein